eukprot:6576730-Lingulodinium_polyedra.AAC.1
MPRPLNYQVPFAQIAAPLPASERAPLPAVELRCPHGAQGVGRRFSTTPVAAGARASKCRRRSAWTVPGASA